MWFSLAIFSAFLTASQSALTKSFLKKIDKYVLASGIFLSATVFLLALVLIQGIPEIKSGFYYFLAGTVALNFIATVLYLSALEIIDLSIADPIISFTPVFLILTSFIMLRELPTWGGVCGIILVVFGYYILNLKKDTDGRYEKSIIKSFKNRGVLYMLAVAFIYSLSSNLDKLTVRSSNPFFGSAMIYLSLGVLFIIFSIYKKKNIQVEFRNNMHKFLLMGSFAAMSAIAINTAMLMQIVPYTISLKRTSMLFSVLMGVIFFKEKNIKEKIAGSAIMLMGVILILFYK
ncbi:MAG: DMT family transporter [Candidatus Moraniibacteriota bacterium]